MLQLNHHLLIYSLTMGLLPVMNLLYFLYLLSVFSQHLIFPLMHLPVSLSFFLHRKNSSLIHLPYILSLKYLIHLPNILHLKLHLHMDPMVTNILTVQQKHEMIYHFFVKLWLYFQLLHMYYKHL